MEKYEELNEAQHKLIADIDVAEHEVKKLLTRMKNMIGPDQRNVSLAATHSEDTFMRLRRAVATGKFEV